MLRKDVPDGAQFRYLGAGHFPGFQRAVSSSWAKYSPGNGDEPVEMKEDDVYAITVKYQDEKLGQTVFTGSLEGARAHMQQTKANDRPKDSYLTGPDGTIEHHHVRLIKSGRTAGRLVRSIKRY